MGHSLEIRDRSDDVKARSIQTDHVDVDSVDTAQDRTMRLTRERIQKHS